jgi:hypothetical protein
MAHAHAVNMITARDGNVSIRWGSQPYWFITPANVRKQQLQPRFTNGRNFYVDGYKYNGVRLLVGPTVLSSTAKEI